MSGLNCSSLANADAQGPCDVANNFCYDLPIQYGASIAASTTHCECSTLAFFLCSACDVCAGQAASPGPAWGVYSESKSCSADTPPTLPPIKNGTVAVPSWAMRMASATPTASVFDLQAALDLAKASTIATSSADSSRSPSSQASTTASSTHRLPPTSSSSDISQAHHRGARQAAIIAGAIVAVLVAVAIIGAYLCWRRKSMRAVRSQLSARPWLAGAERGHEERSPAELKRGMRSLSSVGSDMQTRGPAPAGDAILRQQVQSVQEELQLQRDELRHFRAATQPPPSYVSGAAQLHGY
ncbi:hypothetical protein MIND_00402100 [Mycena indigotica]|uniref:Uncharacterized protein n=1 Tax=Mycena indigotica TaxID=2126181 RepID=A0A8H6T3B6_9AGAR|nr:uncharacterized protein MIND_00402100 [Mycena indigotica]KAF7310281.1 hypothetical protein MIND_00402100 [Mycena indigotica]